MDTQVIKYNVNKAQIAKMSDIYLKLTISDIESKEEFAQVHSARMTMVSHRTSINKLRLSTNLDAQDFIKKNNKDAQELISLMEPIETHLSAQEKLVTDEQKRKEEEAEALEKKLINKRVSALFDIGINMPFFDVAMLSDDAYSVLLSEATEKYLAEKDRIAAEELARKIEAERLEAEAKRLRKIQEEQEAERKKKLASQEAKLEEIRLSQEKVAQDIANKEKALRKREQAIEDAKRKEQEKVARLAFEEQAKIQAAKDADAKIAQEKKEDADRLIAEELEKKRQVEIAPDREKLIVLAMTIRQIISPPAIKNKIAQEIVENALSDMVIIADNLVEQAKGL